MIGDASGHRHSTLTPLTSANLLLLDNEGLEEVPEVGVEVLRF